jgi:hypothetical protein
LSTTTFGTWGSNAVASVCATAAFPAPSATVVCTDTCWPENTPASETSTTRLTSRAPFSDTLSIPISCESAKTRISA